MENEAAVALSNAVKQLFARTIVMESVIESLLAMQRENPELQIALDFATEQAAIRCESAGVPPTDAALAMELLSGWRGQFG